MRQLVRLVDDLMDLSRVTRGKIRLRRAPVDLAQVVSTAVGGDQLMLLALTGYGQEEDRRRSREAGFDHHLVKPIDLERLQELLDSWCRTQVA